MVRSPRKTRSGKPLSSDSRKVDRLLSVDCDPTTDKSGMESAIEACLSKLLSQDEFFDKMSSRLASKLETTVQQAVATSLKTVLDQVTALEKVVADLQVTVSALDVSLKQRTDELEQYQRRNNLRVFGIPEADGEDTDKLLVDMFKERLGVDISPDRLDRSHRVGEGKKRRSEDGAERHRPIIVRFTSYRDRRIVFMAKRKLKATGITIREDLTSARVDLLKKATEKFGRGKAWTLDGKVMWVDDRGRRGMAVHISKLPK